MIQLFLVSTWVLLFVKYLECSMSAAHRADVSDIVMKFPEPGKEYCIGNPD